MAPGISAQAATIQQPPTAAVDVKGIGKDILGGLKWTFGQVQRPGTIGTLAVRDLADSGVAAGIPSKRYNARNVYRTAYEPGGDRRLGAGIGSIAAAGFAGGAVRSVLKKPVYNAQGELVRNAGFAQRKLVQELPARFAGATLPAPLANRFPALNAAWPAVNVASRRAIAAGFVGVVGYSGAKKTVQHFKDDGDLKPVGVVAGTIGAGAGAKILATRAVQKNVALAANPAQAQLMSRGLIGGKVPVTAVTLAAGIAGAVGGGIAGSNSDKVGLGSGKAQTTPIANESKQGGGVLGNVRDFTRGAFLHFTEAGPTTQSVGFRGHWDRERKAFREASRSEQAGAMLVGDLGAAAIMGGGALAVRKRLLSADGAQFTGKVTDAVQNKLMASHTQNAIAALKARPHSTLGMGMTAAAVGAGTVYINTRDAGQTAGVTALAGMGVGTIAANRTPFMKANFAAGNGRLAASALTGAMVVGAMSLMRTSVQQYVNDSRDVHAQKADGNKATIYGISALGGAGGLTAAVKGAKAYGMPITGAGSWKGKLLLGVGALAGAGIGFGAAPLAPWVDKKAKPAAAAAPAEKPAEADKKPAKEVPAEKAPAAK